MKRLYVILSVVAGMALLLPLADAMAFSSESPLYTRFTYMFAHDGWIHLIVNAWALMVLHNVIRWKRLLIAYAIALTLTFITSPSMPVLGASVITTFFFGFVTPYFWHNDRTVALMMTALIVVSCIIPGFAAIFHVVPFVCGIAFYRIERLYTSIRHFICTE